MTPDNLPYLAASDRPLRLTPRPELVIKPQRYRKRRYWVVKDPLSLRYHHLRDEEHEILKMLDGRTSLEEIRRRYQELFAPRRLSLAQLQALLGAMYRQGLLLVHSAGQGMELLRRQEHVRRRRIAIVDAIERAAA